MIEKAGETVFLEIKMSDTLLPAHQKSIRLFRKEQPALSTDCVIYSGNDDVIYHNIRYCNWKNVDEI